MALWAYSLLCVLSDDIKWYKKANTGTGVAACTVPVELDASPLFLSHPATNHSLKQSLKSRPYSHSTETKCQQAELHL